MHQDKLETQKQWNTTPCGTGDYLNNIEYGTLEYFEAIRNSRYEITDTWMKSTIDYTYARGKKLLEVGHGIGTDLLTFCENGAEVYGVDITQKHHDMATLNFAVHNQKCNLKLCDAANLDFPSDFFDVVYSHGVLHHTPDTVRSISEIYRVLKPGGTMILSLYHKYSVFHIWSKLFVQGILRGDLRRLGYRGLMATLENGADGIHIKPLVKTYSKKELKIILADFSDVKFKTAHLDKSQFSIVHRFLPNWLIKKLEPHFGWYVVAFATK